jgi:hypothetical protein
MTHIHVLARIKRVKLAAGPGQCLRHGYVAERCCKGWEPRPTTTYLRDALRAPAEPITARPAIPLRDGDRSVGSASVPRGRSVGSGGLTP